ncbi:EAL domain-containing protein [Shewanella polaris]|uniref:EAL domain-containing protein n=1 Tax=Shewanella polaris TaxID=2588449 RepID=A0A4Y5YD98_9GAMM|nr:EAL domain-containing protein [Shewanella polaris]QDE30523.1 EAL domain-containing protein [Shewanella polaris]
MDSFFSLMSNAVLLLALVVIYDAITIQKIAPKKYEKVLSGIFIGMIAISVMNAPWVLRLGIHFDTRWVLLSLSGLFFGFIPTLIAAVFAACFRIFLGGVGIYVGVLVIFVSSAIGLGWRYWIQRSNQSLNWQHLLALSIVVELVVLLSLLLMPVADKYDIILNISSTLLTVYICGSVLLGLLLKHHQKRQQLAQELQQHKNLLETERNLLQSIIDGIPDLIFYKSKEGIYLGCNKAFSDALKLNPEDIKHRDDYDLFDRQQAEMFIKADKLVMEQNQPWMDEEWLNTSDGAAYILRTHKTPILNSSGEVQGVVGVSRDLIDEKHIKAQLQRSETTYRNIISTAQDGFVIVSVDGFIIESNQSFAKITGYHLDELLNKHIDHIEVNERYQLSTENIIKAKQAKAIHYTSMYKHKQGQLLHVEVNVSFWDDDNGGMFFCFVKDISERIKVEQRLLFSESKFRQIFEKIPSVSVQGYDKNRNVIFWNQASENLYGYSKEQAVGKRMEDLIIPLSYKNKVVNNVNAWINDGVPMQAEEQSLKRADGTHVPVYSSHTLIYNSDNEAEIYCIDIDLSAQKKAEEHASTLSQAIEQSPISIILTGVDSSIEYVNSAFEKITGYTSNEVIGRPTSMLQSGLTAKSTYRELWGAITQGRTWQGDLQNRKKNGELFWEQTHIAPIFDKAGITKHYLALKQDVTLFKQQEEKILQQAHYDSLTGLPNRLLSLDRLSQMLKDAHRVKNKIAVLFLDLDDFKKVNDTMGHSVGDDLLIQAATRLKSTIRDNDVVGRLGGDEFIIMLNIHEPEEAEIIANKLLKQFYTPFILKSREVVSTISIGIALYPFDSEDPKELLRQADSAMYHSKDRGRNIYHFYTEQMNHDMNRRLKIEEQLRNALKLGELEVYFQPVIEIRTRKIVGAEALLRWKNSILGQVSPDEFIPIAEQTSLIVSIGEYVIENAFSAAQKWQQTYNLQFKIAINVSPKQFRENNFVEVLNIKLEQYQIHPTSVELEITEGVLLSGDDIIETNLRSIHDIGVNIAMDDFGTGYSSLSYLRSYPFDTLKVDKSFVNDITVDPADLELVGAAVAMGHALNLTVVAEGIETEEQYHLLNELNCDYGQGYLFSKPLPQKEFEQLLAEQNFL